GHGDGGAESRQLDREAARAGADVEHMVAGFDEASQVLQVNLEAGSRRASVVEARPFLVAVRVVEGRDVGRVVPHAPITSSRSLSPRPERQTRISFSSRSRARASAWAGSSAGRMPSVLARSRKAASASSSVALTYSARPLSRRNACSGPTPG